MSTVILIIAGIVGTIILLVGIGYLLDKYGIADQVKDGVARVRASYPSLRRWLTIGVIAVGILGVAIVIFLIIT